MVFVCSMKYGLLADLTHLDICIFFKHYFFEERIFIARIKFFSKLLILL